MCVRTTPPAMISALFVSSLLQLRTGTVKRLGAHGVPSAICKEARDGAIWIGLAGILGDEQGDRVHHGGPEKAIHHYAFDHYEGWRCEFPDSGPLFDRAGLFGENFCTRGLTEDIVCVGDVFEVGGAMLQISQARQPCWKLDVRTGIRGMAARMQETGRTGWYYRVLSPGPVEAGNRLRLVERLNPEWSLRRLLHYLYADPLNRPALRQISGLGALSLSWRQLAERRLQRNCVEDWSRRLRVPE